jgi:hypothetical protein
MEKICTLIEEAPTLLPIQKEFYKVMISERKEKILDYNMEQLMKLEMMQEELRNSGLQFTININIL